MSISLHDAFEGALRRLDVTLTPLTDRIAGERLPAGLDWRPLLTSTPAVSTERLDRVQRLHFLTDELGSYGYVCENDLSAAAMRLAGSSQEIAEQPDAPATIDALMTDLGVIERLLRALGDADGAAAIAQLALAAQPPLAPVAESEQIAPEQIAPLPGSEPVVPTVTTVDAEANSETEENTAPNAETPASPPDGLHFELLTRRVLSYAMAHNQVPIIPALAIRHADQAVQGAELRFSIGDIDGPVGESASLLVDLDPAQPTVLTAINFVLDPATMARIEEQRPGTIAITLLNGEDVLLEEQIPVQLLAANQWLARPLALAVEMLAAFVMPNHPAINDLMGRVATRLTAATGSGSIQGYQAGPERADQIVAAIFAEMQAGGIRYSNPPASWADIGQKVRTPGDVLEGSRLGTCLDTTVVMAAALEQAGIHPLLWVVQGHAFLGYWREELSLPAAAISDAGEIANFIDLGLIRLVETTLLTGSKPATMDDAHRVPYQEWISGHLERVMGVTDVFRARRDGILPLPARRIGPDGQVTVTEYRPVETGRTYSAPVAAESRAPGDERRRTRAPLPPRVVQWKNGLLDLSLRNRLINFTDSARLPLTVRDAYLGSFEDSINSGVSFTLLPSDQIAAVHQERGKRFGRDLEDDHLAELLVDRRSVFIDVTQASYLTRMRGLAHAARTLIEETGANNLYLAFGTLLWNVEGKPLRSPLVLVPVTLTAPSRGGLYRLSLDDAGTSTPNYCLLEKLRQLHGLELPDLEAPVEDGAGIDLQRVLTATREALAQRGLPFRVEATADLAILQFAKFRLWKDLDENWEAFSANSLVRHLVHTPTEPFSDPVPVLANVDLDALEAQSPMPADSSQLAAVAEAVGGRTFVLEGPPGTGKSQTITNLLTRAIASGKRVLFVAEKRAALEVVRRRLDEVGMGAFCLDLHDKASRTSEVRAQIRAALDLRTDADRQGMLVVQEQLSAARGSLVRYARRLHEANAAGHSLYSARTQELASGDDIVAFPMEETFVSSVSAADLARLRSLLSLLPDVADPAHPQAHHPWGFVDTATPERISLAGVQSAGQEFDAALAALPVDGPLSESLRLVRSPGELAALHGVLNGPVRDLATLDTAATPGWQQASANLLTEISSFGTASHAGLEAVELSAFALPLREIHQEAVDAEDSGFFGRGKRIGAVRDRLAPVLKAGVDPGKHLSELTGKLVQIQDAIEGLARRAQGVAGLRIPAGWNPLRAEDRTDVERQAQWLGWAGLQVSTVQRGEREAYVAAVRQLLASGIALDPAVVAAIGRAGTSGMRFAAECQTDPAMIAAWAGETGLLARWQATIAARRLGQERLPTLDAWLKLLAHVEPLRALRLAAGRQALLSGAIESENAVRSFDRGLAEASKRERLSATGLDGFDGHAQQRTIDRFTGAAGAVREHLVTAIPQDVLDARTFDAAASAGQVGQLQRQLARQRGGMGVRALMSNFGELITRVMPCALVSPDSLARFFPAQSGLFDIVVFDEASQIRVADAIGAMGRANSVVVVGDSKQMPPTSFAEPSTGDDVISDQLGDLVEDEESILSECVQARVPRQWLSWHYRSQDESLIAFSNQQYYENKLSSFPAPVRGRSGNGREGFGISLVRVNGQFFRSGPASTLRTNPIEAEAVVAEIRHRFDTSPGKLPSLGVVTFNIQQRNLIEALLRDSGDARIIEALDLASDGLFVKNLENVQGDERDVIFFSTAFSVNERGYLPLNFGPLNRAGGERRLNVAITRARKQVVVFSSFDPDMLRAEETSSVGVKHLRAYLDVAAQGTGALPRVTHRRTAPDRHREEIAAGLRERGYAVSTDVGLSDFKIDLSVAAGEEPGRPVMAVLLDGPGWAARRTVGDRDGLPVEVLSRLLRWPVVHRVWMPAWLADPGAVLDELEAEFDRARAGAVAEPEPEPQPIAEPVEILTPVVESVPGDPVEMELRAAPAAQSAPVPVANRSGGARGAEPLVLWQGTPGMLALLDTLPGRAASRDVAARLSEVVETEGPVHIDRMIKLVAASYGLSRVAESRSTAIRRLIDPEVRADPGEPFAWPARLIPNQWHGFRLTPPEVDRPVEQISRWELANAMASLCHAAAGMSDEELKRETLALFGGRRMTTNITAILTAALDHGLAVGRLTRAGDGLIVAGNWLPPA